MTRIFTQILQNHSLEESLAGLTQRVQAKVGAADAQALAA